jgi:hypothetical protein
MKRRKKAAMSLKKGAKAEKGKVGTEPQKKGCGRRKAGTDAAKKGRGRNSEIV